MKRFNFLLQLQMWHILCVKASVLAAWSSENELLCHVTASTCSAAIANEKHVPSFNTRLYWTHQPFTTYVKHTQAYSWRMRGHWAVVFSKSTQSNIILLLKKGNHGNDIFQAGESLDRHAFKAPFVSSWKWMWDSSEFSSTQAGLCRQRSLEQALSPTQGKGKKILLHDQKYRKYTEILHTLHIRQTLKYHCVLVDSGTDACTGLLFCV